MSSLCRDCGATMVRPAREIRCQRCHSPRLLTHPELESLAIAHIDCDAFYASIEKRDDPALLDRPVIVGGGRRGVVAACCYIARQSGVHSAMPMFKARRACPNAVVLPPNMAKYRAVGQAVRFLMLEITPMVQPLSIDEAFLDLRGTERLHGGSPAATLARLARRIESDIGVTVSIGLSYNKFLAKIASDIDKPRGFAVIGRAEAFDFLTAKPVGLIWGVGAALQQHLVRDGITTIGQLRSHDEATLVTRYGVIGQRLSRFARGEDDRPVTPEEPAKSLSAESTFETDIFDPAELRQRLWRLSEKVATRLKRAGLAGGTVQLKLKTADFRTISRSRKLSAPSQLAEVLYRIGLPLLEREADGTAFRLIGIGASDLVGVALAEQSDLFSQELQQWTRVERTIDAVRDKLGPDAIVKGRSIVPNRKRP